MTVRRAGSTAQLQRDRADDPVDDGVACPDWLGLRREADTRARDEGAAGLLADLVEQLAELVECLGPGHEGTLHVVDLGAGTGANHHYLHPRLPFPQRWTAIDHDGDALTHPGHGGAERVVADVADLGSVLVEGRDSAAHDAANGDATSAGTGGGCPATLVTCSALLDVLTRDQLTALADAIAGAGCPALLSLTVTGGVSWSPPAPEDGLLRVASDAHQQRDGRPGPGAAAELEGLMVSRGYEVRSAATPWRLDATSSPELLRRWLVERVATALEQDPSLHPRLDAWRARRLEQLDSGALSVVVDHVDLLLVPRGA